MMESSSTSESLAPPDGLLARYVEVLWSPRGAFCGLQNVGDRGGTVFLLLLLIPAVTFLVCYHLSSDPDRVKRMLQADNAYRTTQEQLDEVDAACRAVDFALNRPGGAFIAAALSTYIATRSFLLLLIVIWIVQSLAGDQWHCTGRFFTLAAIASSTVSLGILVEHAARILVERVTPLFSASFFLRPFDGRILSHTILFSTDLFVVWYLCLIAWGIHVVYRERLPSSFLLVLLCWFLLCLGSFQTGLDFWLGM